MDTTPEEEIALIKRNLFQTDFGQIHRGVINPAFPEELLHFCNDAQGERAFLRSPPEVVRTPPSPMERAGAASVYRPV